MIFQRVEKTMKWIMPCCLFAFMPLSLQAQEVYEEDEDEDDTEDVRNVPDVAWQLIDCCDKPTTIILDGAVNLAPNLIGEDGSIALRITQEPFSKELCYRFQKALVSTSANISGEPAAQNYCDIDPRLIEAADYVCWSRRQEHKPHQPSSIIRLRGDGEVTIIRK